MLSNSSAFECMNFKVLWNFKDVNECSSEIQAWQYLGVSPVGVLSTAPLLVGKAIGSCKASLEMNRVTLICINSFCVCLDLKISMS